MQEDAQTTDKANKGRARVAIIGEARPPYARKELNSPQPSQEDEIHTLLRTNESHTLEYKSSMRWDMNQDMKNPVMEEDIAKSLCAFMNADGGNLLIGVDDDGVPIGLEKDYSTFKSKDADGFDLHMAGLITKHLGQGADSLVQRSFPTVEGMEICRCNIKRAPGTVFMTKNKNEKMFYVRINNRSVSLRADGDPYEGNHSPKLPEPNVKYTDPSGDMGQSVSIQITKKTEERWKGLRNHPEETFEDMFNRMIRILDEDDSEYLTKQDLKEIEESTREIKAGKYITQEELFRKYEL